MNKDLSVPPQLAEQQRVGGFEIVRFIGRGGMAEVYEARDLTLSRRVAIKVPRSDVQGRHQKERFLNEARKAALIDHQNVITIHTAGEHNGRLYLVMQFVDGQDLSELLRTKGNALDWYTTLKIVRLAARGLHAVHQQGLVHRDIKPSNIMLSADSNVYLMDFGLVRHEASELTETGDLLGTPPFMSPEQCRGERLDYRSDIYSLSATLYCLISGHLPFNGSVLHVVRRIGKGSRPTPLPQLVERLPLEVSRLVETGMSPRPADRFLDAQTLSKAISGLLKQFKPDDTDPWDTVSVSDSVADTLNEPPRPAGLAPLQPVGNVNATPDSGSQWVVGGVGLALALVGLGLIAWLQPGQSGGSGTPPIPPAPAGMALIPVGSVQLGNDEQTLRVFFGQFSLSSELDRLLLLCGEAPATPVEVASFWIDKYEVSNLEYAKFVAAAGHPAPKHWTGAIPPPGKEDYPVVNVSYSDAAAFAEWSGKQLPTREQWIRAFRGEDDRLLPWGNTYESTWLTARDTPGSQGGTTPVTATPKDVSPFQVYNLAGNAMEFVRGTFARGSGSYRMVKGAGFKVRGFVHGVAPMFYRYGMEAKDDDTGFRCVIERPTQAN